MSASEGHGRIRCIYSITKKFHYFMGGMLLMIAGLILNTLVIIVNKKICDNCLGY
jgi:hypothetical protein